MVFRRSLARVIDIILLVLVALAPIFMGDALSPTGSIEPPPGEPPSVSLILAWVWMLAVLVCYFPSFESSPLAASPGKLVMGLKVVQRNGQRMNFKQALFRVIYGPLVMWFLPLYRDRYSGGAVVTNRNGR